MEYNRGDGYMDKFIGDLIIHDAGGWTYLQYARKHAGCSTKANNVNTYYGVRILLAQQTPGMVGRGKGDWGWTASNRRLPDNQTT